MNGIWALLTSTLAQVGGASATLPVSDLLGPSGDESVALPETTASAVVNSYIAVFVVAFIVTLLATPPVRRLAVRMQVVDWPDERRKEHPDPVAYLGGVAVFLGLLLGIGVSYFIDGYQIGLAPVRLNILAAFAVILLTGLIDDVFKGDPFLKIGGQFVAAACLALDDDIGGQVAMGLLQPVQQALAHWLDMPGLDFRHLDLWPGDAVFSINLVYWLGAVVIAVFVIGGSNAANLIDGLDGLLTGSVSIMAAALLAISVLLAVQNQGDLTGARVVLCYALLGSTLGFLPHNFRPATIFLGDAGSLLLGFSVMVIVLMLGETGRTHLVFAGLIVFGLPILDTTLAIIRRKLNGLPISAPDNDHLHHMLKRTRLGTVGSVFVMYGITAVFAMTAILLVFVRARVVYAMVLVLGGFIVVTAIKAARRKQVLMEIERVKARREAQIPNGVPRGGDATHAPAPAAKVSQEAPAHG